MNSEKGSFNGGPVSLTYFYDFIRKIKANYALSSWLNLIEEIEFTQEIGPEVAELVINEAGAYELHVDIGYGEMAVIELETDGAGRLQPVMGGIIKG